MKLAFSKFVVALAAGIVASTAVRAVEITSTDAELAVRNWIRNGYAVGERFDSDVDRVFGTGEGQPQTIQ